MSVQMLFVTRSFDLILKKTPLKKIKLYLCNFLHKKLESYFYSRRH